MKETGNTTSESRILSIVIVGAGLSGAVSARILAERGYNVYVIDKRDHIGGNCYDFINQHGIRVSQYGAHLFHTNSERVWDFVNKHGEWTKWEHSVLAQVDGKYVPVPPNITTVNELFDEKLESAEDMEKWLEKEKEGVPESPTNGEEAALGRVGKRLYEAIFKHYTYKQWAKYPHELEASVLQRLPVRNNWDTRYFNDEHQALPMNGYTEFIRNILKHELIEVHVNVDFFDVRNPKSVCEDGEKGEITRKLRELMHGDECKTVFTGPIDAYFAEVGLPRLEYRSVNFMTQHVETSGCHQPCAVVNFPSANSGKTTRTVEYKQFLNQKSDYTTLVSETTTDDGDPYYPVPNSKNRGVYKMYQALAEKEEDVYFLGRLASYKYFNMDQAILNAMEFWDTHQLLQY